MSLEHRKHNSVIFWLGEIEEKRRSEKDVYQAKCEAKMPVSDTIKRYEVFKTAKREAQE